MWHHNGSTDKMCYSGENIYFRQNLAGCVFDRIYLKLGDKQSNVSDIMCLVLLVIINQSISITLFLRDLMLKRWGLFCRISLTVLQKQWSKWTHSQIVTVSLAGTTQKILQHWSVTWKHKLEKMPTTWRPTWLSWNCKLDHHWTDVLFAGMRKLGFWYILLNHFLDCERKMGWETSFPGTDPDTEYWSNTSVWLVDSVPWCGSTVFCCGHLIHFQCTMLSYWPN